MAKNSTLSPIIMEVIKLPQMKGNYYWRDPIFHFHHYGKSKFKFQQLVCTAISYPAIGFSFGTTTNNAVFHSSCLVVVRQGGLRGFNMLWQRELVLMTCWKHRKASSYNLFPVNVHFFSASCHQIMYGTPMNGIWLYRHICWDTNIILYHAAKHLCNWNDPMCIPYFAISEDKNTSINTLFQLVLQDMLQGCAQLPRFSSIGFFHKIFEIFSALSTWLSSTTCGTHPFVIMEISFNNY